MKVDLSGKTGRFAKRTLSDFSENMILLLTEMPLCPYTKDFPLREDVMVDYYTVTVEMLLEKCFLEKIPLSKEGGVQSLSFLLGTIEKEAHRM